MKIAGIIARVILGLVYAASSIVFFLGMMPQQEMGGSAQQFMTGLFVSGYMLPTIKVIELVAGLALLTGRFVPLALVVIFPITLNIALFHGFLAPEGLMVPFVLLAANLFLAYIHREKYQPMLVGK